MIKRKQFYDERRKTRIIEAKAKAETRVPEKIYESVLPEQQGQVEEIQSNTRERNTELQFGAKRKDGNAP